ncbi:Anaphase-promoting complex subunit 10 [Gracilariopsis chorda]|uniref:Anaphase-promoting complex subunit 10 n=1 Tax=Gracilariopsis chorda TaxID=448386 RepID=A0A2V3J3Q2_9FLOR|nr:Anaphase-promoting complex subunit 10 [Gracilariopsis chorda]|eukprot:PXF48752.1 Anaphase-promoting complex subunit 10 [Gracilariopsis chorda]
MFYSDTFTYEEGLTDSQETIRALQALELRLRGLHIPANGQLSSSASNVVSNDRYGERELGEEGMRDLTNQAVWTVSTAKPGNGVEQLLDGNPKTYWQSDGLQPHTITAHFSSKVKISEIQLHLNFEADESYTPAFVSVQAGSNLHDLYTVRESRKIRLPKGWVRIPMGEHPDIDDECTDDDSEPERGDMTPAEIERVERRKEEREKRKKEKFAERQAKFDESQRKAIEGVNGEFEAMRDRSVTKTQMIQVMIIANHLNGRDSRVRMVRVLGPKTQLSFGTTHFTSKEFQMYETIR